MVLGVQQIVHGAPGIHLNMYVPAFLVLARTVAVRVCVRHASCEGEIGLFVAVGQLLREEMSRLNTT